MIARRKLLVALALSACGAPLVAFAQPGKIWRVGFFYFGSRQSAQETGRYAAFLQGMREQGYVEGKNFVVEARYADGGTDRLAEVAAELARSKVDVIVSTSTQMNEELRKATSNIPVVFTISPDPVAANLAKSLARPGGKFTGLSIVTVELSQKYLELLSASVPKLSRVAVLSNPTNWSHAPILKTIRASALKSGIEVFDVESRTPEEIERGFAVMARSRVKAAIVPGDSLFLQQVRQIAQLALKYRLATLYAAGEGPVAGGLMSYGTNIRENYRLAAKFVDRILKGAKPGDLPIEQPTKFELVLNLKTAKALGLTVPQEMRFRADRVIE